MLDCKTTVIIGLKGDRRAFSLRLYYHRCPNVGSVIKLTRFPIRHPNASVRRGLPWQIALVQSVARRELEKVGHRGADEVGMWRLAVAPAIDIRFDDTARVVNVVTIDTGAMILVLARDLKATNRSVISFATAGYAGRRGYIPRPVDISFLCPQAHDDRRPARMTLRQIRCDQIGHSAAAV